MKIQRLHPDIEGPAIVSSEVFEDERGYFFERFNADDFKKVSLPSTFYQDNQSHSLPGVLRGLHYQLDPIQGKLLWVTQGKIFDVIVDLRPSSPSFLKWATLEIDSKDYERALWIPPGFAHGYCILGQEPATVLYKVTELYNPQSEVGIIWNDSDLKIPWPVKNPLLSEKDKNFLTLKEFRRKFKL